MTDFLTFPFYALGVVFGVLFMLLLLAVTVVVVVVHHVSFAFCAIGLHVAGCWIRRNMTTPVLLELRKIFDELRSHTRKNPGL